MSVHFNADGWLDCVSTQMCLNQGFLDDTKRQSMLWHNVRGLHSSLALDFLVALYRKLRPPLRQMGDVSYSWITSTLLIRLHTFTYVKNTGKLLNRAVFLTITLTSYVKNIGKRCKGPWGLSCGRQQSGASGWEGWGREEIKCVSSLLEQTGRVLLPDAPRTRPKKESNRCRALRASWAAKLFL